jgi:hypothetical protein
MYHVHDAASMNAARELAGRRRRRCANVPTAMFDQFTPFCPGSFWMAMAADVKCRTDRETRTSGGKGRRRRRREATSSVPDFWGVTPVPKTAERSWYDFTFELGRFERRRIHRPTRYKYVCSQRFQEGYIRIKEMQKSSGSVRQADINDAAGRWSPAAGITSWPVHSPAEKHIPLTYDLHGLI